jgi:hypothetical protein
MLHILQGPRVDYIVALLGPQQLQKIDPALALGALKPRKQIIANVGAIPILALKTRARIISLEITGHLNF